MNNHYVYKITNLKNGKIYIGVRSAANPHKDTKYMGSSTILKNIIRIEGVENFKKEIIKTFSDRIHAALLEKSLVQYALEISDYNCYNIAIPTGVEYKTFRKDIWYDYYDHIRNDYKCKMNTYELAKKYGCDDGTIRKIIIDIKRTYTECRQITLSKIPSNNRNISIDNNIEDIIKMYTVDHKSLSDIGKYYNVNVGVIRKRLIENNIQFRNKYQVRSLFDNSIKLRSYIWGCQDEIFKLYELGYECPYIAKHYNVDCGTMRKLLKTKYNIKRHGAYKRLQ